MMMMAEKRDSDFLLFLFVLAFRFGKVSLSAFSMRSQGQMHVLNAGADVSLHCEFHMERFNLFDNPILWQKIQYHESSEINMMGNIKEPFDSTGKFSVSYNPVAPRYTLGLTIKNLSLEDSGNYSCEVRAPRSELLGHVTHRIFVRAPVIDVAIVDDNSTYLNDDYYISAHTLSFIENEPKPIRCIAKGGNPPPDVEITNGRLDVTDRFNIRTYPKLSGAKGFRLMQTTTIISADKFVAGAMDDGKRLKCRVAVPGLGSQTAVAKIEVSYAPTIYCEPAAHYLHDNNAHLSCDIRARPSVTALFWMLDGNGTVVAADEVVNEYWIINTDTGDNGLHTQLYLRKVRRDSFRTYTVVAENSVAVTTRNVELRRLYQEPPVYIPQTVTGDEPKSEKDTHRNGYIFTISAATRPGSLWIALLLCVLSYC